MKKGDSTYFACCLLISAFVLSYCATFWWSIPLPKYYPLEHTWRVAGIAGVPSQGWYGKLGFAVLISALVSAVGYFTCRSLGKGTKPPERFWFHLAGVAALVVALGGLLYIAAHEFHRWNVWG